MARKYEINIDQINHKLASAQAASFFELTVQAQKSVGTDSKLEDILTFLVISSFSMELYLKSILLRINDGVYTSGHELHDLYSQIPAEHKRSISQRYLFEFESNALPVTFWAIKKKVNDSNPPDAYKKDKEYKTFDDAISSVSNMFNVARYFFEKVSGNDFSYIECPHHQILSMLKALDETYKSIID